MNLSDVLEATLEECNLNGTQIFLKFLWFQWYDKEHWWCYIVSDRMNTIVGGDILLAIKLMYVASNEGSCHYDTSQYIFAECIIYMIWPLIFESKFVLAIKRIKLSIVMHLPGSV